MKKIINKRLENISAFIKNSEKVIDIGCDHALLGIYLVLNRQNIKVISSDINPGPLKKAQENLIRYHVEDKIELRLGNGLEAMDEDIETVIISGMGGISMINILKNIKRYPKIGKIILSPNNDFPFVRLEMSKLGYKIDKEIMILENNKFYPIMVFIKGHQEINYYFGKLDLNDGLVKKYYKNIYNKNKKILQNIDNLALKKENELIMNNIFD